MIEFVITNTGVTPKAPPRIRRVGEYIVIMFLNNTVLPVRVVESGRNGFSCTITLYMTGELRMLNWRGASFSDNEMQDYFRRNLLRHVIGCSVFNGITSYVKPDCFVESHGNMYVIFFPNGMKFPVMCDSGVVICDVEVTKSNEQSFLCRVVEINDNSVEFKIGIFEHIRVRWLRDSIKYNETEAVFRGSHVRTSHLLRKMLLKW